MGRPDSLCCCLFATHYHTLSPFLVLGLPIIRASSFPNPPYLFHSIPPALPSPLKPYTQPSASSLKFSSLPHDGRPPLFVAFFSSISIFLPPLSNVSYSSTIADLNLFSLLILSPSFDFSGHFIHYSPLDCFVRVPTSAASSSSQTHDSIGLLCLFIQFDCFNSQVNPLLCFPYLSNSCLFISISQFLVAYFLAAAICCCCHFLLLQRKGNFVGILLVTVG